MSFFGRQSLRWYARGWRALYDACRDENYPQEDCGQGRLNAAWNATAWTWRQWYKWDEHRFWRVRPHWPWWVLELAHALRLIDLRKWPR